MPTTALSPTGVQDLLKAAQQGSRSALGQLFQAYRPLLLALARQQLSPSLRGKAGASDLVQDTFVDACTGFGDFSGHTTEEFRHWIVQIVRHNACDLDRHFRGTGKRQVARERSLQGLPMAPVRAGLAAPGATPDAEVLDRERFEALQDALDRLPEEDRRVLLLRHRDHLPFDQVARQLGCTPAAARQRWVRAVDQWRRVVEGQYGTT
jgi:RNA polymerase sigma-70 factor (ECF subfamily)